MLVDEAIIISELLSSERNKTLLNVCSSDEAFWKVRQPFIWEKVMKPVLDNGNSITNLDMKNSKGVDIVADCTDMQGLKDSSYDIVLFTSGIEHIIEINKALSEIRRLIKPQGFMICSAPGVYPRHNDPIDTMLRFPTLDEWNDLLKKDWQITNFLKSKPVPAKPSYNFKELVFATIVKAFPLKNKES